MSYRAAGPEVYRRSALFVTKILQGGNPADIAVEQPSKFELVINAKTAKMLGITVPPTLLRTARTTSSSKPSGGGAFAVAYGRFWHGASVRVRPRITSENGITFAVGKSLPA